ncbi:MAG: DUF4242 domain-containing protein, partial [Saprospiraceae bacterium]|nr:DUF4242 domain-containing protein [Saprospiraceae bacterium]
AGSLDHRQLQGISKTSCDVIDAMGKENIQWIESYITEDKVFCKYLAINEDLLREHAERGGFPINKITQIQNRISPRTASDD